MASIISTKTSGNGGIAVTGDTSGVLQLASADGTTAVTIDASQNVGVGATPSAWASNLKVIQFPYGNIYDYSGGIGFASSGYYDGTNWKYTQASPISIMSLNSTGSISFFNSPTGTVGSTISYVERMRITSDGLLQFNNGYGSVATAYGCRAWVNFNGTGTVAIRASGNVTSITDNGVGKYRVNFTTALTDANYSCTSNAETTLGSTAFADLTGVPNGGRATTYVDVICINSTDAANFRDVTAMMVAIHR